MNALISLSATIVQRSRRLTIRLAPCLLLFAATTACGADAIQHAGIHNYLDASTTVVGWVDLTRIDVDELEKFRRDVTGSPASELQQLTGVRDGLTRAGVTRVYWISDLAGVPKGPRSAVIPCDQPEAVSLVVQALVPESVGNISTHDNAVLIGSEEQRNAIRVKNGDPAPELLDRLNAIDAPHGIVAYFAPETLQPLLGALPQILRRDESSLTDLSTALAGLRTVSIAGQLPPTTAELQLGMASEDAARKLSGLLNQTIRNRLATDDDSMTSVARGSSVVVTVESVAEARRFVAGMQMLRWGDSRPLAINSLKQIALALHNFHDVHGHFPPHALVDDNGRKLLSWRVLILPYLEEKALYDEFRLDEPWNSEHNRRLISRMPNVLKSRDIPAAGGDPDGITRFVAPLNEKSIFGRSGPGVKIRDVVDGTSNTVIVIEAAQERAVQWTQPDDLVIDMENPMESITAGSGDGFAACLSDGSARQFAASLPVDILRALVTMNGHEVIDWEQVR